MNQREKLNKYLEGLLSEEEKIDFESYIQENIELQEYISRYKKLEKDLESYFQNTKTDIIDNHVIEDINTYSGENYKYEISSENNFKKLLKDAIPDSGKFFLNHRILKAVAFLAMLIVIGSLVYIKIGTSKKMELYSHIYEHNFNPMNDSNINDLESFKHFRDYSINDSLKATLDILPFKSVTRNNTNNIEESLIISLILMEYDKSEQAIEILKNICDYSSGDIQMSAKWYLSMCYLKNGDISASEILLLDILKNKKAYSQKANDVINKLNSF